MQGGAAAARALLGVGDSATASEIRAAFRAKVKVGHPDHGGPDAIDVAALSVARDLLLHRLTSDLSPDAAPDAAETAASTPAPDDHSSTLRTGRRWDDPARVDAACGTMRARAKRARNSGWRVGVYRVEPRTPPRSQLDLRA